MIRLALSQANLTVGDLGANAERIGRDVRAARDRGADLVLFPELALTGYPPEDLLLKPGFLRETGEAARALAAEVTGIVAVVGSEPVVRPRWVLRLGRALQRVAMTRTAASPISHSDARRSSGDSLQRLRSRLATQVSRPSGLHQRVRRCASTPGCRRG